MEVHRHIPRRYGSPIRKQSNRLGTNYKNTRTPYEILEATSGMLGEEETYTDTYDIIHLHSRAAAAFALDRLYVPHIEKDISRLPEGSSLKQKYTDEKKILASCTRWTHFCSEAGAFLRTYRTSTDKIAILSAVRCYIEVLTQYFSCVNISWTPPASKEDILDEFDMSDALEDIVAPVQKSRRSKKNTAGSIDNFMRCITDIETSDATSLSEVLVDSLDRLAELKGMYTSKEIREMPLDEYGRRGPYCMSDLLDLLRETDNTTYYPKKWLVSRVLWGWSVHTFGTALKEELKRDCSLVYSMCVEEAEDVSSINREWLALRLLINYRHRLSKPLIVDDFDIIKTADILEGYESMWSRFCVKNAAWKPVPIYGSWDCVQ